MTTEIPVGGWVLPGLLVATWALLCLGGSRRARLWFVLLAPFGTILVAILAAGSSLAAAPVDPEHDVAHFMANTDTAANSLGTLNGLLALAVSVPLLLITLVAEVVLLLRRSAPGTGSSPGDDRWTDPGIWAEDD
ncbi:hypothetical protein [Actinoplanes sp. N902-109]|uniref:hypothetical protein n=1 Tax=Actinoplanes sp. (strain N902-109) TaxID=649831 RepID=UPI0003295A43|nr:hypothetical protein [Actinoplanes sp. N902-109]AGL14604.1 hypothetical protein L083_1094 [Actinoplanes sp. N902-109]